MSLYELREIAKRQQEYIGSQQKLILSREAKLQYLKQASASNVINDQQLKVNRLRDTVNLQEGKLRKLKALRGQMMQINNNNHATMAELESIRSLFSEKEKELAVSLAKVEALTRQLEELKNGINNQYNHINSKVNVEINKLKQELLHRNALNERQNLEYLQRKKLLGQRKSEILSIDERIQELQQRLSKKRLLNQQLSSQMQSHLPKQMYGFVNGSIYKNSFGAYHTLKTRPINMNIATVEPLQRHTQPVATDSVESLQQQKEPIDSSEFVGFKKQHKYETLPYNTKFGSKSVLQSKQSYSVTQSTTLQDKDKPKLDSKIIPSQISSNPEDADNSKENIVKNINDPGTRPSCSSEGNSRVVTSPYKSVMERVSLFSQITDENSKYLSSFHPHINDTQPKNNRTSSTLNESDKKVPKVKEEMIEPQSISINVPTVHKASIKSFIKPNKPLLTQSNLNENLHSPSKASSPLKPIPPPRLASTYLPNHSNSSASTAAKEEEDKNESCNNFKANEFATLKFTSSPYRNIYPPTHEPHLSSSSSIYSNQSCNSYNLTHLNKSPISSPSRTYSNLNETLSSATNFGNSSEAPHFYLSDSCLISNCEKDKLSDEICNRLNKESSLSSLDEVDRSQPYSSESLPNTVCQDIFQIGSESSSKKDRHKVKRRPVVCDDLFEKQPPDAQDEVLNGSQEESTIKNSENDITEIKKNVPLPFSIESSSSTSSSSSSSSTLTTSSVSNSIEENAYSFEPILNDDESGKLASDIITINVEDEKLSLQQSNQNNQANKIARTKSNLKNDKRPKSKDEVTRRVSFDPLALLLDAALEGELELVKKVASEVPNPSASNDEGITALHNTICAGHFDVVQYLVEIGCDVNAPDSDGWTPLHCAASCNNLTMVKFLVENGACIFATTLSDRETAAEKCEEGEEGFDNCSQYLYNLQEELGLINLGKVYAVYDYEAQRPDELSFEEGDCIVVLRRGDDLERDWWWAQLNDKEGYIPRNLIGLHSRHKANKESSN